MIPTDRHHDLLVYHYLAIKAMELSILETLLKYTTFVADTANDAVRFTCFLMPHTPQLEVAVSLFVRIKRAFFFAATILHLPSLSPFSEFYVSKVK